MPLARGYNGGMFLRPCYRRKNGKRHAYWALCESYRTERGPRQRVVAYLGQLDEAGTAGRARGGGRKPGGRQRQLFDDVRPQWVEVDASRVRVENCRAFGGPWLGLELVRQLGLKEFLDRTIPTGDEEIPWSLMALVLVLCRLCDPSSELHIAEHSYAQSGLADLLGVPAEKVNEQRLYRALDALLAAQGGLGGALERTAGRVVPAGVRPAVVRRDLDVLRGPGGSAIPWRSAATRAITGRTASRCASPWWSRRAACRWATRCSRAIARDVTTLEEIVTLMERRYGQADRIWVVDRGMVSEKNLEFLARGEAALHRGHAQEHAQAVRAAVARRRLARGARGAGSEALPVAGRRGDVRALPQPRSPREGKGDARPLRAADRRRAEADRSGVPAATPEGGHGGAARGATAGPEHAGRPACSKSR